MPAIAPPTAPLSGDERYHANLRRLIASRWLVLAVLALAALLAPPWLGITPPTLPILAILALAAAHNGLAAYRLQRQSQAGDAGADLLLQLLFDLATLAGIVFFSGGATNPLISLLLPTVAIAALTLPGRQTLLVGAVAIAAYSLLLRFYLPLPIADASQATRLHLLGMWLTFVLSAIIIGGLIVRMTGEIRARDAALAAAREQALRDEGVLAMGTLAAGAAHELGTPLGTIHLIASELANDESLPRAAREDLALIRQQLAQCKAIITSLTRRAGLERLEQAAVAPVDQWLESLRNHWHAARPMADSRLQRADAGPAPRIVADPRLEQAVLNLLNNAANASPEPIEIRLDWGGGRIRIDVVDRGPGFPPGVIAHGGQASFPAHAGGSGMGLVLARSAIEQRGGTLTLSNPVGGGALARIEFPESER